MSFSWPFWLILAIPLAASLWLWPAPRRSLTALRAAAYVMALLGLAGLCLSLPGPAGTVVVVADRSLSMPPGAAAMQKEALDLLRAQMAPGQKLALVSFGEQAQVEMAPQSERLSGAAVEVGAEGSDLSQGLQTALSIIDRSGPARIIVLSDGLYTGMDPAAMASQAAAAGIPIDFRHIARAQAGDLAVQRIEGPASVAPGEAFMLAAWVNSPVEQDVSYELTRGATVIASGNQRVAAGASRLVFRDKALDDQTAQYVLTIRGSVKDPVPENNSARLLVGVRGQKGLLLVSPTQSTRLSELLSASGLPVRRVLPSQFNWTLEELSGYAGVVIENTPADAVGPAGMETLSAWIRKAGGGLMMTGGRDAYGTGGYFKSPLEGVLPVSMELRQEHRKLSMAIVVALDRSGSMAIQVPDGRTKIDLADLATVEVINMLGGVDQFGCIAIDSIPHTIVPLSEVTDRKALARPVLRIGSEGGGIFIYEALSAAAKMISPAKAGTKHILLFADASDSEEPGDYATLVSQCRKAGITVSVIGLGTEKDCDANLLKDIARIGGGQCMFTQSAHELPRLFAQDTFKVARSTFVEEKTRVSATAGLAGITSASFGPLPNVGGYNLCYLRSEATPAAVTVDEFKAPLVAYWRAGSGRVLCCTAEADGKFTGAMGQWKNVGEFFGSMARWTAGSTGELGGGMVLTQEMVDGLCRIRLHLDPQQPLPALPAAPELGILCKSPGQSPQDSKMQLSWTAADVLEADIPLQRSQTMIASLDLGPLGRVSLPPVCSPYSSEYAPPAPGRGAPVLEKLAQMSGGMARSDFGAIWRDLPQQRNSYPLQPYLLLVAAVLLLLEVFHRRTGLLGSRQLLAPAAKVLQGTRAGFEKLKVLAKAKAPNRRRPGSKSPASADSLAAEPPAKNAPAPAAERKGHDPAERGLLQTLSSASSKARSRTRR